MLISSGGMSGAQNESQYAEHQLNKWTKGRVLSDLSQKVANLNNPIGLTPSQQNALLQN